MAGATQTHISSREEALRGSLAPPSVQAAQALQQVRHYNFHGVEQLGQIMVHRALASEVQEIFEEIFALHFPLFSVLPAGYFGWSDDASMAANNSSAFNYRRAVGRRRLSLHAHGRAVDLNPVQNPYIKGDLVLPPGAIRDLGQAGTLLEQGGVVAAFERRGWTWGGRWTSLLDWHHFEKRA